MIIKLGGKRGCSLIISPTYWGIMRGVPFWPLPFNKSNNSLKSSNEYQNNGLSRLSDPTSIPYSIPSAKNGWRGWCSDWKIRERKSRVPSTDGGNDGTDKETAQTDQRREESIYPPGYTPPYAPNVYMEQAPPMQHAGGFPYAYTPPPTRVNKAG